MLSPRISPVWAHCDRERAVYVIPARLMASYYQNLSRLPGDYCDVCVNEKKNDPGEQDTSLSATQNVVGHLRNDDVRVHSLENFTRKL